MSLALNNDTFAVPALDQLTAEISRQFLTPEPHSDGERLSLLEQVLDFASTAEQQLAAQNRRIAQLEALTRTDDLTGLLNRRGLEADLARLLAEAARHGSEGVICYIDIDDFKIVNDSYGHGVGDVALCQVASALSDNTRLNDLAARVGGDEFVVVLTGTDVAHGLKKARKLQRALNIMSLQTEAGEVPISVSLGIQSYDGETDLMAVLQIADSAMYAEKRRRKPDLIPIAT
jgi:diguanylate cyclase (GGDEF)-like protein